MMDRPQIPVRPALRHPGSGCDEILEQQPIREAISDGLITARIKMEFSAHAITAAHAIHVDTIGGSVELSGFVETASVRAAAILIAENVEGVQIVNDAMDVRTAE